MLKFTFSAFFLELTKCYKLFFFCFKMSKLRQPTASPPSPLRPLSYLAPSPKNLHTFAPVEVQAIRPEHPTPNTMDKKKAELISILWTVVKVAVGYLIGYITNNPEAADGIVAFLNY